MCAYACAQYDLSRGQGPGGLIQTLKFCWEENEDLKNSLHLRLQITAFSRWATGLQSSLFHWSAQRSVCIKYSKNGLCILARWLFQFFFLTLISAFSSVFFFMRYPGFALLIIYRITITETLQKCKLHTRDKETLVRGELRLISHCCFQPWNYPHFSLITWTNWQDVLGRIHPPTRPCILHAFWRTRAVHLTKREIEHLFFMEREWVRVKWDRCVFLLPCDRDALVCAWQWQTTDQRSTSTVTNACIEWLTAPNTSLLLISCIFGDKSCPSHLKSGSAAECRI